MSRVQKIICAILQPSLIRRLFYISVILCLVATAFNATLPVSALTLPVRSILLVALALAATGVVGITAKHDGGKHG